MDGMGWKGGKALPERKFKEFIIDKQWVEQHSDSEENRLHQFLIFSRLERGKILLLG